MREKFPWWKLVTGFVLFIFFHQIYGILGGGIAGAVLGESFESIYSHMKMYFHAYLIVSIIDYFIRRRQIDSARMFWTARMLVAASFPWMSIAIWFIPVALGIDLGKFELSYSLALTLLGLYLAFRLDEGLENVQFRPALQSMIWLAFAAAVITFIGFSFHVPDNFFIAPK
jgi:purine-cytosine permease-like protein